MTKIVLNHSAVKKLAEKKGLANARQLAIASRISYGRCNAIWNGEMINAELSLVARLCSALGTHYSKLLQQITE